MLTLVYSAPAPPAPGFTTRDLMELTRWVRRSEAHGYRRILLESGTTQGGPEDGGYVLVYAPGQDWASWGLVRDGGDVVVWHCGSGCDLGRFGGMMQALESLPPALFLRRDRRAMSGGSDSRLCEAADRAKPRLSLVHP